MTHSVIMDWGAEFDKVFRDGRAQELTLTSFISLDVNIRSLQDLFRFIQTLLIVQ